MDWIPLQEESQLNEIGEKSFSQAQVLFKHSTRCSVSSVVKGRLDKAKNIEEADFYFLDLIRYRAISDKIAEIYRVRHESPQALIIKNGQCIYNDSHMGISIEEIKSALI